MNFLWKFGMAGILAAFCLLSDVNAEKTVNLKPLTKEEIAVYAKAASEAGWCSYINKEAQTLFGLTCKCSGETVQSAEACAVDLYKQAEPLIKAFVIEECNAKCTSSSVGDVRLGCQIICCGTGVFPDTNPICNTSPSNKKTPLSDEKSK